MGGAVLLQWLTRSSSVFDREHACSCSRLFFGVRPGVIEQAHRTLKAVRRSFIMAALGLAAIMLIFPDEAGSRIALYAETLLPSSSAYEVNTRTWDYPIGNLLSVFDGPHWVFGQWHWYRLSGHAVCKQAHRATSSADRGRGGIRVSDRRDGDHRAVPLDSMDGRTSVSLMEGGQRLTRDAFLPDRIRNFMVCVSFTISIHVWRLAAIPELCQQCIPLAPRRSPLPLAGPVGFGAGIGGPAFTQDGCAGRLRVLGERGRDVRHCGDCIRKS